MPQNNASKYIYNMGVDRGLRDVSYLKFKSNTFLHSINAGVISPKNFCTHM